MSITETTDGYLVAGRDGRPPGVYYFTTQKLFRETNTALPTSYNTLNPDEKLGYLLSKYELHIAHLEQIITTIKKSGMTASDKARINQEIVNFEKTTLNITRDIEKNSNHIPMYKILYETERPLEYSYRDLKLQYQFLAETKVDKHIYLTDELQKRYGTKNKVTAANLDGIIITKAGSSYYNLDLGKVQKYTISDNRIDIITKGKTYFLYLNDVKKFPTYVGLGVQLGNNKYVFNTSKLKKPVANEWILINDVVKFMMANPKKTSLKHKDLVITKGNGAVYNIQISRVYTNKDEIHFLASDSWQTSSTYYDIATKGPTVVHYFIRTGDCIAGGYVAGPNAVLKFKNFTYKITIVK